ncbi:hypothetical protein [Acutalibacter intestini]|uniref:hypothetical protein n=1 Tax=Acutalibacter intestini TaxID=3093659 RepID=UPI002AC955D0|nr:hypothetical protein [Acutalibacter sp. M00204]
MIRSPQVHRQEKRKPLDSPSIETAEQLLAQHRFAVILVDLELFAQAAPEFPYGFRRSPYVIVLGNAGTKYARRVKDDAHLFLPYQITLSKLWSHIMKALSLRIGD